MSQVTAHKLSGSSSSSDESVTETKKFSINFVVIFVILIALIWGFINAFDGFISYLLHKAYPNESDFGHEFHNAFFRVVLYFILLILLLVLFEFDVQTYFF